ADFSFVKTFKASALCFKVRAIRFNCRLPQSRKASAEEKVSFTSTCCRLRTVRWDCVRYRYKKRTRMKAAKSKSSHCKPVKRFKVMGLKSFTTSFCSKE